VRWMLLSLLAGICLSCTCDARAWDYVASRGTTITSERPIAVLALEAIVGGLHGSRDGRDKLDIQNLETELRVDGKVSRLPVSLQAVRKLAGFAIKDAPGSVERTTTATVRGRSVRVVDAVANGRVRVRVVIGPPLGDPRVRCAVLTLEAKDDGHAFRRNTETRISLQCSAIIDLPGDRCRLVRRIAVRAAEREAGPELSGRIQTLADTGRRAILSGRSGLPEIVARFIHAVTSQER